MAEGEGEYRELLRDLRLLYKHEKPDSELRILAFVRRDRYTNLFVTVYIQSTNIYGHFSIFPKFPLPYFC